MKQHLIIFLSCLFCLPIHADELWPFVNYSEYEGEIIIGYFELENEDGRRLHEKHGEHIHSAYDLAEIRDPYLEDEGARSSSYWAKAREVEKICTLGGHDYRTVIEPHFFSGSVMGQCGASLSVAVTIYRDGKEILEKTPFQAWCADDKPVIVRITVNGKTGKVDIARHSKDDFYSPFNESCK